MDTISRIAKALDRRHATADTQRWIKVASCAGVAILMLVAAMFAAFE